MKLHENVDMENVNVQALPAGKIRSINVGLTLLHRLRRWNSVKQTLIQRLVCWATLTLNEMNRALCDLCAHIGLTGPGEPPEDGEIIGMTLSSRHRIRNSSPGGLRPSTLPLGHGGSPQYWLSHVDGEETFFVSFKPPRPGTEPRTLARKAAVLTTTLGPPPYTNTKNWKESNSHSPTKSQKYWRLLSKSGLLRRLYLMVVQLGWVWRGRPVTGVTGRRIFVNAGGAGKMLLGIFTFNLFLMLG